MIVPLSFPVQRVTCARCGCRIEGQPMFMELWDGRWMYVPVQQIRAVVRMFGPISQFDIADHIGEQCPNRWDFGTVRSACARAGLSVWPHAQGVTPRGRKCNLYELEVIDTAAL